jgi:uncharacterized membrane protein YwzB
VIRDTLSDMIGWEDRHKRLVGRLLVVFLATVLVDLAGTVAIFFLDRHAKGTEIHNLFDAFFFTTVQLLTVSSQLKNPLTTAGRVVDIGLEMWAVVVVAGSAGAIANFFQDSGK